MIMDITHNHPQTENAASDDAEDFCLAHLFIVEDDRGRREFLLEDPVYSIGRDPKCDIRLASQFVSRRHATLVKLVGENGQYYYRIVDGNLKAKPSSNGILINGHKQPAHDLQNEDEVVFSPRVRAVYYILRPDTTMSEATNGFDDTVVNPEMEQASG